MCFCQDSAQAGGCVVSTALFVLVLLLYETLLCAKIKLQGFFFLFGGGYVGIIVKACSLFA